MAQQNAIRYHSGFSPVDILLDGGLKRGFVLELSGPPGTCKESLALGMVQAFAKNNQNVLFVGDAPAPSSPRQYSDMILFMTLHTLPDLMVFLHKLPWYLDEHPRVVVTTQLSTKLLNVDGSPATFDTGARAIMMPQPCTS
ncbi:uncharacterized protein PHACADRAFT_46303, partial [Phanerochaete carnosa HHB-10118-sp]